MSQTGHVTAPCSVRDLVQQMQLEIRTTSLLPARAQALMLKLTALIGNCSEEIRIADAEYAVVLLRCLDANEAANRARIRAEITPEYLRKREARDTLTLVVELIRSLKYLVRATEEEMRLSR